MPILKQQQNKARNSSSFHFGKIHILTWGPRASFKMTIIAYKIMCLFHWEEGPKGFHDPREKLKMTKVDISRSLKLSGEHLNKIVLKVASTWIQVHSPDTKSQAARQPWPPVRLTLSKQTYEGTSPVFSAHTLTHASHSCSSFLKQIHVVNKACASCHSQNNTGLAISGKKYTFLSKILLYLFTMPWQTMFSITTKLMKFPHTTGI